MRIAKEIEARLAVDSLGLIEKKPEILTFREYAELWLVDQVESLVRRGSRRQSTLERYRQVLKHYVYPAIGNKLVDQIKPKDVGDLYQGVIKRGRSSSLVSIVRAVISGPLNLAVYEELIPSNPAKDVLRLLNLERRKRHTIAPMTTEEARLLLKTCLEYQPVYYAFFVCAFNTGMRLGELLGLQFSDFDWHSRFIEVRRSYKRGSLGKTKTGKSRRVDMSGPLCEVLKDLYHERRAEAQQTENLDPLGYVFQKGGKAIEQNHIRRVFKRVLVEAGLREMRLHDIRHFYASQLLTDGRSPVYVKEQLGHSSIDITVDIYGHLIPSDSREAVDSLVEKLGVSGATTRNPGATGESERAANPYGSDPYEDLVPKRGFEPRRAYAH
ncbi:tyrosine-type recombinase/integrase [candidate division KSB1 bacterium]